MRRCLIVVRLGESLQLGPIPKRIGMVADTLRTLGTDLHMAFSTKVGDTAGLLLKTDKPCAVIRAAVERSHTMDPDAWVMVFELGDDFSAIGNSSGWRWMQH